MLLTQSRIYKMTFLELLVNMYTKLKPLIPNSADKWLLFMLPFQKQQTSLSVYHKGITSFLFIIFFSTILNFYCIFCFSKQVELDIHEQIYTNRSCFIQKETSHPCQVKRKHIYGKFYKTYGKFYGLQKHPHLPLYRSVIFHISASIQTQKEMNIAIFLSINHFY